MPRSVVNKSSFDKAYGRLSNDEKQLVDFALQGLNQYFKTGKASVGLGITQLGKHLYECRAGLLLRLVYWVNKDQIILSLLGTHDEVCRFLKRQ